MFVCFYVSAVAELLQAGFQQEEEQQQAAVVAGRHRGDDRLLSAILSPAATRQQAGQCTNATLVPIHHRVSV